ncbi:NADP-dependent oxidoreductase domain-containing protein [Crepidotus variabilis]|uniref:NADP-dependent oxidoreductase domain-containing protein n=1 Tax=Crepidotus variabilis TaxID=179855 RepID=A0A9P6JJ59_9AGAR|nr:NADP-dependent oxidoreductase domain-containing protein [Crepidotus variabilis]
MKDMDSVLSLPGQFSLPSGDKIPSIGLGVWRSAPNDVGEAVKVALKAGYRHIDDAWIYGNEREVGNAIKESSVPRKDIWITSKLWNTFHKPEHVEWAVDDTLSKLGTSYLDLYLIHWPVAFNEDQEVDWELTENPYPTWQKMEEMVEKGKIRNIGVSNFNIRRLQNLTANNLKIKPAINQVELNYWYPQPELLQWSKDHGILLEAYSPLGSAERVKETLQIPEVKHIAEKLDISPAQVYISWHIQRGTIVLPKSVTPARIEENFKVSRLPLNLFEQLENAASAHKPARGSDPSKHWGVDIFE